MYMLPLPVAVPDGAYARRLWVGQGGAGGCRPAPIGRRRAGGRARRCLT
jgi:hypothetical protein